MASSRALAAPQRAPVDGQCYGLAYFRVSTVDQANTSYDEDGFSIQAQRDYCQHKAADMGVQLVDEYIDRGKSARTADRPGLQAMLARLKEDTDIQYVFVHKLDRLARNRQDDVQIGLNFAKSGVRLVSCTENIDDSPSGRLVHGIMADIAEWYSANLSEEAKKGMRKKVEIGGTPGKAPLGYVNTRLKIVAQGKDIGVVQVHDTYGPLITECFRLYDTGRCTLSDVVAHANNRGLRLPADKRLPERPVTIQYMQRILRNRYYIGWIRYDGVEYKGEHPPLIDEATFDRVQALLTARDTNKDKSAKRPHYLKGMLYCARCGRHLGITVANRRRRLTEYPYFFCFGRQLNRNRCTQGYIPIGDLEAAMRDYWERVHLPDERIQALRAAILERFADKHEAGQAEIAIQKRRVIELEQRRQKAKAAYFANALDLPEFKTEQETIRQAIKAAEGIIARWSVELESIAQALDDALRLLEDPQVLYDALPEELKMLFVQTVFEKLWVLDHAVVGSELTEPYAELLTFEAQLALVKRQRETHDVGSVDSVTGNTYYRSRVTAQLVESGMGRMWRPFAERPHGWLAIDERNLQPPRAKGSKIHTLVGVMRFKLNKELARFLRDHSPVQLGAAPPEARVSYSTRRWRVRDRLSAQDIEELTAAFKAGTAKWRLAERYGINIKSVKKLLREEIVGKRQGHTTSG